VSERVAVVRNEPRPNGWWGMLLLLATESALFGTLIATYFYLRFQTQGWPPGAIEPPTLTKPLVYTAILVLSSVPMLVAVQAARAGRRGLLWVNLLGALAIGALYLWLQADLLRTSAGQFTPRTDAYGSIYYTLQVAHAAHVFVALLLNLWLLSKVWRRVTVYRLVGIQAVALYWHFVNALAVVVVFTIVSPSL
jgi:heme/copper-type cytochrome/quinol oxidase subunit 3